MAATLGLGTDNNWATKENSLLAYNSVNNNFKPLPFDFTRATDATRVNKLGLIETVSNGQPRIDFLDNINGNFLIEPQRANLVTYSEDFSHSSWVKLGAGTGSAAIVTSNYAISPDGTLNASRLQCDLNSGGSSSSNQSLIYDVYSSSGNQTISIYVKSNNGQNQTIYFANTQTSGDTIIVTPEWKRFTFSHSTSTYVAAVGLRGRSGGAIDDTADILIYAAQAEQGSYASSYIPTAGSAVTRNQEVPIRNGIGSVINSAEGVLFGEVNFGQIDTVARYICVSSGSATNRAIFGIEANQSILRYYFTTGSSLVVNANQSLGDISIFNKIAIKWKVNDFAMWLNGVEVATDTSGAVPSAGVFTSLRFTSGGTAQPFFGKVKELKLYNTALTDSELQTLTTI